MSAYIGGVDHWDRRWTIVIMIFQSWQHALAMIHEVALLTSKVCCTDIKHLNLQSLYIVKPVYNGKFTYIYIYMNDACGIKYDIDRYE